MLWNSAAKHKLLKLKSVLTPRNFAQWTNIAQSLNPPPHILQISPQFFGYVAGLPYDGEKGALGFRNSN